MPDDNGNTGQLPQQVPQFGLKQPNLVILNDGSRHLFPSGTTVDQMHKALNLGPPQSPQTNWVDTLRPFLAGLGGATAAAGATFIPGVGESGIGQLAADTQGYALVDSLLKYLGAKKPVSYKEALTGSEADAAVNAVAGKLVNGVFRGIKGFINADQPSFYNLAPTTSQALEKYGMKALATVPKFLEDYGVPASKAAALDNSGGKGFTQALAHANAINGRMAGTNSDPQKLYDAIKGQLQLGVDRNIGNDIHYASADAVNLLENGSDHFKVLDDVIGNTDKLSKVLKVGQIAGSSSMNVKQDLAAYKFMDMVNKATTKDAKGGIRIDPNILGQMWNDPKMATNFDLLYGKGGKETIGNFFKDIAYTQANQGTNPALGRYIRYGSTAGKFILGMGALQHAITTGSYMPIADAVGIQIGASTVGRLLTNPTTSKIIAEAAKGTLKQNPTFYAKVVGNALRNQTVGLVSGDGHVTEGSIQENHNTGTLEFQPQK